MAAVSPDAALGIPGVVTIKGREFVLAQPTAADHRRIHNKMREIAQRGCVSPLEYVNANAAKLDPVVLSEAVRNAILVGSGGGVEPNREAVFQAYDSLEGVRFRLWYLARKANQNLLLTDIEALVTDANFYDVSDALALATTPQAGPDAPKAPTSGAT